MSPKNPPLIVGLAAPGLLWLATSVAFGQDLPPSLPGPSSPAPTPSSSKAFRALLLTNGKVIPGDIVEDTAAEMYRLRQNGGSIGYPKIMVQKAGQSIEELYRFQVARLPEGDPDERMKLARWCLTQKLAAQAREQLEAVQAMCPDDPEARRMLYNLASAAEKAGPVDGGVQRTSGEMIRGEAPGSLDPRVINRAQKRFNALPEIFDLPQAQAVKRANEFADYVQPVLQQNCVRCHDEKYQGDFQLVEVRTRRDQTSPDIARANLDATLRLVNPDDPARSSLLSAGLVPHGGSKNAIFRGANDQSYQVLARWAKSLRASRSAGASATPPRGFGDGVARTGYAAEAAQGEGFASERAGRSAASRDGASDAPGLSFPIPPPRTMVDRIDMNAEFLHSAGDRPQFPAPFSVGGAQAPPRPMAPKPKAKAAPKPGSPAELPASSAPVVSKQTATPAGPGAVLVTTEDPNELPGMDLPRYPPKAEPDPDEKATKKVKKPIDPDLLEKMMRNRNGGGTP